MSQLAERKVAFPEVERRMFVGVSTNELRSTPRSPISSPMSPASMSRTTNPQVVIVGAGPAGMLLAYQLGYPHYRLDFPR